MTELWAKQKQLRVIYCLGFGFIFIYFHLRLKHFSKVEIT